MLKNVLYKAVLFTGVCLMCVACSQEDDVASQTGGGDGVTILVRIADSPATRATEPGWDEGWNENTIERLDIFRFAANGEPKGHLLPSNLPSFTGQNATFQTLTVNGLTYNDLANNSTDVFYLVANCPQLSSASISSFSDLQAMMITPTLDMDAQQTSFVMDARTSRDSTDLYVVNEADKKITLRFELYRAAAKIRIAVKDESGNDILDKCKYKLYNFVQDGTSVLAESEAYGEGEGQSRTTSDSFLDFTLTNDSTAVFYTYPNDWFDESLLTSDGVFADPVIYTKDNLIDETKRTYIMLEAPYGGDGTYYYQIPVNLSIADFNDQDGFTADEIKALRKTYYSVCRNTIYDVTVTVDRAGGSLTDPVTPEFHIRVNDWEQGGDYNIGQGEFQ